MGALLPCTCPLRGSGGPRQRICTRGKRMKNRRLFISIFAVSLAVTLFVSPVKVFNNPVVETIQVQAEEEPITDTQRGVALLMTIMLAQGLRFVGDWNTVVQPGLVQLWEDFSTATGNAVTLPMLVAGSSLALGYIRTSNTVNNAIANFTAWYKQTFDQPVTGDVSIPVSSGGTTYFNVPSNTCVLIVDSRYDPHIISNVNTRAVYVQHGTKYDFFLFTDQSGGKYSNSNTSCSVNPNSNFINFILNSTVVAYYVVWSDVTSNTGYVSLSSDIPVVQQISGYTTSQTAYEYTYGASAGIGDVSMEGQSLELKDGYQLESDQAKLYDIAGLEALVASLALTLENIDDLVRDIPLIFDTPWAEDFPDVPAYVDTPDDTIPWVDVPDSVIPADTPEYVPTIPSERDEYKVLGLDQVFPFSIPFDLYYLSQILVSDPETPEFQYAAVNPVNGNLLTVDVDLHDFDGVASIFRTCETVLFIAFLIWITRSLIRS